MRQFPLIIALFFAACVCTSLTAGEPGAKAKTTVSGTIAASYDEEGAITGYTLITEDDVEYTLVGKKAELAKAVDKTATITGALSEDEGVKTLKVAKIEVQADDEEGADDAVDVMDADIPTDF